jgi:NitT/TauT family transport system permease protein
MKFERLIQYVMVPLGIFFIALLIYYIGLFNRLLFPNPIKVLVDFLRLFTIETTYFDTLLTLARVVGGTLISALIGIPLGLLLGYFNKLYNTLEFMIDFLRSMPVAALFPLFILFFGIGDLSKIVAGAWLATLIIIVNTSYGVRHANKSYIKLAKIYNTSKKYVFLNVIFPGALPSIFSSLRIGVSMVLVVIIITEMFMGAVNGLGYSIINAQFAYRIPELYALIILTGIIGYVLNRLFLWVEKRAIHWT